MQNAFIYRSIYKQLYKTYDVMGPYLHVDILLCYIGSMTHEVCIVAWNVVGRISRGTFYQVEALQGLGI